jgi:hypothetical protein
MARIDLKYATVRLVDGGENTSATGAVNNVAGYTVGAVTIACDGFAAAIATGSRIKIGSQYYTVASTVGGATPTSITIAAPGLRVAVVDNAVIIAYGLRKSIDIKVGEGTLTYDETRTIEYLRERGLIDEVREGDQNPMDVSLDLTWDYITGPAAGTPSPEDAMKKRGLASTWASSDSDACRPYAVDIEVDYIPNCAIGDREIITLPDFRYETINHDLKASTLKASGKCNATQAIVERMVQ